MELSKNSCVCVCVCGRDCVLRVWRCCAVCARMCDLRLSKYICVCVFVGVGGWVPTPHLGKTDLLLDTMPQYCPPTDKIAPNIEINNYIYII